MSNLKYLVDRQIELNESITKFLTNEDSELDFYILSLLQQNIDNSKDIIQDLKDKFYIDNIPQNMKTKCNSGIEELQNLFPSDIKSLRSQLLTSILEFCKMVYKRGTTRNYIDEETYEMFGIDFNRFERSKTYDPMTFYNAMEYIIDRSSKPELENIAERMYEDENMKHFLPLVYGADFVREIERPFYFVHFTGEASAYDIITTKDLLGRQKPSLSTEYGVSPPLIKNEGYLYGYALDTSVGSDDDYDAVREVLTNIKKWERRAKPYQIFDKRDCSQSYDTESLGFRDTKYPYFSYYPFQYPMIFGTASKGIEIFSHLDNQKQVIIPISCINRQSLFLDLSLYEMYAPFGETWSFEQYKKMVEMLKGEALDWSHFVAFSLGSLIR